SKEDDPETVLIPRLLAAKADMRRIAMVHGVWQHGRVEEGFHLDGDIERVRDAISKGELSPDAPTTPLTSVFIDPVADYWDPRKNPNLDTNMRAALNPWRDLAREFRVCIIGVAHLRKDLEVRAAVHAIKASGALTEICRVVNYLCLNPKDRDERLYGSIKSNSSSLSSTLVFSIPPRGHETKVSWMGEDEGDLAALLEGVPTTSKEDSETPKVLEAFDSFQAGEVEKQAVSKTLQERWGIARPTAYRWVAKAVRAGGLQEKQTKTAPVRDVLSKP
ncbi:MAG: AAA family ATPase, partial [candidate division NC10 bacterium]|nr:AAA family ATPase [candidate division NC10 bacterium]